MSRFRKLFAANAIAAAGLCSAAVALSASAAADPAAPPVTPGLPALNVLQQFATNPASAAALLQTAATALTGASSIAGAPAQTVPVSPIAGAPAPAPLPGAPVTAPAAPAAAPTAPAAGGVAGPIIPLLNQLGVPASLANLTPDAMPFPVAVGNNPGISNPPVNTPGQVPPAASQPLAPAGAGLGQLLPLSALP
ncbi:hypothetical protein [Candidatus Mycolicibacterium alkanivorans]|uniref:Uncharacterized protein n=1 Tax=Candidatus Mycolicibacterium alkanivorans TaxID=2954114 RepID=A0ABS9YUL9_9MYCO|nr:hypothetical protein [Candidatus Mycolicibacterium alkanivorans]MCI4674880.1 hypothetical protein [Candidatus Mycolicibacterium alkanivorans]